jgi:integrase
MKKEFGEIREIGGNLYIDCRIYRKRVRLTSNHPDTPDSRRKVRAFLDRVGVAINDGSFRFKDFFPRAKEKELQKFAAIEARLYGKMAPLPHEVVLCCFIKEWLAEEAKTMGTSKKVDYNDLLNARIIPMLGHLPFSEIGSKTLKVFVRELKHADGPQVGEYLSAKRMRNLLNLLRTIYRDACLEHKWILPDPFPVAFNRVKKIETLIEERGLTHGNKGREVWLLDEWLRFIECVPEHFRPLFECMRNGMIFSELKALKKESILSDRLVVSSSFTRGVEKAKLKTKYRSRYIPLTSRLKESIGYAIQRSKTDYVFTMEDGITPLNYSTIREDIWAAALQAAGLPHRTMYSLRHTFIGWMVLLGVDSVRLKALAGHASRSTLSEETYGEFREGLQAERQEILGYLGRDVLEPEEFKRAFPHIYLTENGIDFTPSPSSVGLNHDSMRALASMVASEVYGSKPRVLGNNDKSARLISVCADNYGGRVAS